MGGQITRNAFYGECPSFCPLLDGRHSFVVKNWCRCARSIHSLTVMMGRTLRSQVAYCFWSPFLVQ